MIKEYIFPITTLILLLLFFLGIPDLDKCRLRSGDGRSLTRRDALLMSVITLVFGVVDFAGLGNTSSPETFAYMGGETAFIQVSPEYDISGMLLFPGTGEGDYIIDWSSDGENYTVAAEFNQNYNTVFKWQNIDASIPAEARFVRVYASGNVWMGEIGFKDINGDTVSYTSGTPELNDEQEKLQTVQTYMNSTYFDEIYHARTAWEHLNGVYPYEISHPPLGKIIIGIGITLFGMTPFGWRFSGTLFGVLMLPVIYCLAKRMFKSTRAAFCTALLTATDFMHFVQTRIATIDTYAVFFILLMYLFMYDYVCSGSLKKLAISGIFFGIGAASKWTCIYAGAGLAVIWAVYRIEHAQDGFRAFLRNCLFCLVFFVTVPAFIYYLSYIPYGEALGYKSIFSADYFKMVADNQSYMFSYHSGLVAEHPYSSKWYQWLFDLRPILYYLQYNADGTRSSFGAFLNPVLCWGGLIALPLLLYCAIVKKDRTAGFILIGYLAQLLPWVFITRLTFEYHYFPCSVFLALALGYVCSLMENGSRHYKPYIYGLAGLSACLFILFYPALSGVDIDNEMGSKLLGWLPDWPF